jgi:hypothetical protein
MKGHLSPRVLRVGCQFKLLLLLHDLLKKTDYISHGGSFEVVTVDHVPDEGFQRFFCYLLEMPVFREEELLVRLQFWLELLGLLNGGPSKQFVEHDA